MCGIAGFLDTHLQLSRAEMGTTVLRMADSLIHRGPDDVGTWVDPAAGIALGHRRLSIVDLSPEGHQPMVSQSGRYVIVFNGEIYNFKDLRDELEGLGYRFRGTSDTEVMLESISHWGLDLAVGSFNGMFAFALWDREERLLHLVRDRLGEKPLYYGWMGKAFLFGSELKALRAHPNFRREWNRDAAALFLRHNYVPAPYSIYRGISKLEPGALLTLPLGTGVRTPSIRRYWSARQAAEAGIATPFEGDQQDALNELDRVLRDAVRIRMHADVPLGAFLSGGLDSSTVVALMQAQSARPIRTFTIGFQEAEYNEAEHAKAVARHLGTDHTELYVRPEEARAVIPAIPTLYDEPFSDVSQIPTFLVSQLARRHVTVSLSGDGGDELFGGYTRYFWAQRIWRHIGWMPPTLRQSLARSCTAVSPQQWDRLFRWINPALPSGLRQRTPGDKLHKLAAILSVAEPEAIYFGLVSHWKDPAALVLGANEPSTPLTDRTEWADVPTLGHRMMYFDTVTYLPDDILVKVDRASMGVSLESRIPFLDHRVVEFAWQLPLEMKIRDGQGKWLLRQLLYKYVPPSLIERPKMGFGVPIDQWLRGPLHEWAETLLDEKRLRDEGLLDPTPIRAAWEDHLAGRRNWQYHLWDVLMLQAWTAQERAETERLQHEQPGPRPSVVEQTAHQVGADTLTR